MGQPFAGVGVLLASVTVRRHAGCYPDSATHCAKALPSGASGRYNLDSFNVWEYHWVCFGRQKIWFDLLSIYFFLFYYLFKGQV
jgi:hypothetical protein